MKADIVTLSIVIVTVAVFIVLIVIRNKKDKDAYMDELNAEDKLSN